MATEDQCSACGERNPAGSAFCVFCGTYLGWEVAGQGPAATAPSAPTSPAAPTRPEHPPTGTPPNSAPPPPAVPPSTPPTGHPAAPTGRPCPQCGTDNPATRRFCGRCGFPLVAAAAPATPGRPPAAESRGWWDRESRAARREYRRSLPGLYRLNRVLLALTPFVALAVILTLTGNNPVGWVKDKYRELTVDLEPVDGVAATAQPKDSVAGGFDAAKLPGPREEAWATAWPEDAVASDGCGTSPAGGRIVLRWDEPTRVRGLAVWAGLDDASTGQRELQFRPKRLGVVYDNRCVPVELEDTPDRQELALDTETEVTRLRITVDDVYPSSATPPEYLVAIGGLEVLHQPE